jgi:pimeloyl-ACP methyl ester carboxylesterase
VLSLLATAAGLPVTELAVYEPPFMLEGSRTRPDAGFETRLRAAVAADDRDAAVEMFMTEAVGMPAEVVAGMRRSPAWPGMTELAHTLPYDVAIVGDGSIPVARLGTITVPTLVIAGGASPAWAQDSVAAVADAVPESAHITLDGQQHNAEPDVLVPALAEFFLGRGAAG